MRLTVRHFPFSKNTYYDYSTLSLKRSSYSRKGVIHISFKKGLYCGIFLVYNYLMFNAKEYYQNNKEKIKKQVRKYQLKDILKHKQYQKKYKRKNKKKLTKQGWLYHKNKDFGLYQKWLDMKRRCNSPTYKGYEHYGGRGIKILWKSYGEFFYDMFVSFLAHKTEYGHKETTLDRINTNENYYKNNCRWATHREQQNNRRNNI